MPRKPSQNELANRKEFSSKGKTNYFSAYNDGVIHVSFWQEVVNLHIRSTAFEELKSPCVVDAGGGGGRIAQRFKQTFPLARVELLDINPDMLKFAHETNGISKENVHISDVIEMKYGGTSTKQGSLVPNESVDHVISNSVLWILDDPALFFKEVYRVLKKGGRLSVASGTPDFRSSEKREVFISRIEKDMNNAVSNGSISVEIAKIILESNRSITANMNSLLTSEQAIQLGHSNGLKCIDQSKAYVDMFFFLVFEKS
jgi:ubiquinone/menaquinone biosynthesis C-methylase UbiE